MVLGLESALNPRFSPYDDFGRTVFVPEVTEGGLMPELRLPVYEEVEVWREDTDEARDMEEEVEALRYREVVDGAF